MGHRFGTDQKRDFFSHLCSSVPHLWPTLPPVASPRCRPAARYDGPRVMRRWITRQFQPDRRWQSLALLLLFAWVALNLAFAAAWDFHSRIDWEQELRVTREMSAQADRVDDLAAKQRLLQAIQARASRLQTLQLNE